MGGVLEPGSLSWMRVQYPYSWRSQAVTPMSQAYLDRIEPDRIEAGAHHCRKLTGEQANEIRLAYASGEASQGELAERFGVGRTLINRIITNRVYVEGCDDGAN